MVIESCFSQVKYDSKSPNSFLFSSQRWYKIGPWFGRSETGQVLSFRGSEKVLIPDDEALELYPAGED